MPNGFTNIAVVWQYTGEEQIAIKVIKDVSAQEEAELEEKYKSPSFEVQLFSTSNPDSFDVKKGVAYDIGYDPLDTEQD